MTPAGPVNHLASATATYSPAARRRPLSPTGRCTPARSCYEFYAVEARLIGFDGIPPLHESLEQLRACDESFLGVRDELRLVGAVAWTRLSNGALDICRLVVHPVAHRRGVATALLDALDSIEPAELTVVSTGTANLPAVALYRQRGFIPVGERQIAPGVTVTLLERKNASASQSIHNS
ncbi:GNAT family N-acetyltransferase [Streptomyces sp. Wh19]|uniref:GNAT family N-acetyltransferase n=1 Tax=Streptomyces sp. Wh19 TaxID=3076629 RepID=UPI002958AF8D|nr:GNAT family N-acetyltransferase [Streptomyces sp. Wh19]MDV9200249.1 GNAT family N-acetyltransferase [Streptomyces sp. Wh19]